MFVGHGARGRHGEQKARGIADSPQRFADDIQAKANGSADAPLVKALTDASAKVLEWLTKQHGIRFELVEGVAPGHSLQRMHALADRGGSTLLSSLYSALGTHGVRLQPSAQVTELVVDEAQRIIGVRYKRNGSVESVGCTTLILACNGFAGNSSLVAKYLPDVRGLPFAGPAARATLLSGAHHSVPSSRTSMDSGTRSGGFVAAVAAAVVADDRGCGAGQSGWRALRE